MPRCRTFQKIQGSCNLDMVILEQDRQILFQLDSCFVLERRTPFLRRFRWIKLLVHRLLKVDPQASGRGSNVRSAARVQKTPESVSVSLGQPLKSSYLTAAASINDIPYSISKRQLALGWSLCSTAARIYGTNRIESYQLTRSRINS